MAHSVGYGETTFYFNGDFEGEVAIHSREGIVVTIPIEGLKAFFAEMIRRKRVERFEQMKEQGKFVAVKGTDDNTFLRVLDNTKERAS